MSARTALTPEEFAQAFRGYESGNGRGQLYIVSANSDSKSIRARMPHSHVWFAIPPAAVAAITPIGPVHPLDPGEWYATVAYKPEFALLHGSFAQLEASTPSSIPAAATPEPCPVTTDDFLGEPGKITNIEGGSNPPAGDYVRLRFFTDGTRKQRFLMRQGGRVVGRFYGDFDDPRSEICFDSDGGAIHYEFQVCTDYTDGSHAWLPYTNYISDHSAGDDKSYALSADASRVVVEWGPSVRRPAPPPAPAPPIYLHTRGRIQCGGWGWRVATNYAFAWTTIGANPDGPRVPVAYLKVTLRIGCREFSTSKDGSNVSDVVASEQFRGIGVPVCCDTDVSAEARLADGRTITGSVHVKEP